MRCLAALLIMLLSVLTGRRLSERLRHRRQLLESLLGFVRRMSAQISYALAPPENIICGFDDGEAGFFCLCSRRLDDGVTVEKAWLSAAQDCTAVSALRPDERRLLHELGAQLGVYDAQLQLTVLKGYEQRLEELCRRSAAECAEQSRLYSVCSLLVGALLSILII